MFVYIFICIHTRTIEYCSAKKRRKFCQFQQHWWTWRALCLVKCAEMCWNSNTWPADAKSWLTGKDPDAEKDWGREEKGTTEEMVGWHHRFNGHGFGWTPGVGDGQGGLVCCGSWGFKESDMTEWLNWTEMSEKGKYSIISYMWNLKNKTNEWL